MAKSSFLWYLSILKFYELEYQKNFSKKFKIYFFKELKFLEFEFYGKLEFHDKLEFQKGGKSLHISKTVVDC